MTAADAAAPPSGGEDRTARARIRDVALQRFADDGIAATSLRSIAEDVGVSPPLVIHYFGSKGGLRAACDTYLATQIRKRKRAAMGGLDPLEALRQAQRGPPLLRYLARTLAGGSPQVAALVDELVEDAVEYMAEGIASGALQPTEYPRERAVVLAIWNLGALVLSDHVERLLGVDLVRDVRQGLRWAVPASEILAKGVLTERFYQQWRDAAEVFTEHDDG